MARPRDTTPEESELHTSFRTLVLSPLRERLIRFFHATANPQEPTQRPLSSLREVDRAHIYRVLDEVDWNKNQAAKVLEISQGTLYREIFEYGLEPGDGAPARAEAPPRRDGAAH